MLLFLEKIGFIWDMERINFLFHQTRLQTFICDNHSADRSVTDFWSLNQVLSVCESQHSFQTCQHSFCFLAMLL